MMFHTTKQKKAKTCRSLMGSESPNMKLSTLFTQQSTTARKKILYDQIPKFTIKKTKLLHSTKLQSTQDLIQPDIFKEFLTESMLYNKHDFLMSQLRETDQTVTNHMNLNHFTVNQNQCCIGSINYTLFSTIMQLDKSILQPLMKEEVLQNGQDEVGQPFYQQKQAKDKFKPQYLKDFINSSSESVSYVLRQIQNENEALSLFIESIWKYIVLLLDTTIQWVQGRCKNFVDESTQNTKQELNELKRENSSLNNQLVKQFKEYLAYQEQETRRYQFLEDKYKLLQEEFNEFKAHTEDLGSLDQAKNEMKSLQLNLKEFENLIKGANKTFIEKELIISTSLKEAAKVFIKEIQETQPRYIQVQNQLQVHETQQKMHPFCYFMLVKQDQKEIKNPEYEFINFFEHLQNQGSIQTNVCNIFLEWSQDKVQTLINWLISKEKSEICELFCILFGIRKKKQLSQAGLNQLLEVSKGMVPKNDMNFSFKDDKPLKLNMGLEDSRTGTVVQNLLMVIKDIQENEKKILLEKQKKWSENIIRNGFNSQWHESDIQIYKNVMQYFYATEDDKLRNFILSSTDGKKRSLIDLMNKFKYKIKVSQIKNIPGNDNQKSAD